MVLIAGLLLHQSRSANLSGSNSRFFALWFLWQYQYLLFVMWSFAILEISRDVHDAIALEIRGCDQLGIGNPMKL
jgi:hypothetical protein